MEVRFEPGRRRSCSEKRRDRSVEDVPFDAFVGVPFVFLDFGETGSVFLGDFVSEVEALLFSTDCAALFVFFDFCGDLLSSTFSVSTLSSSVSLTLSSTPLNPFFKLTECAATLFLGNKSSTLTRAGVGFLGVPLGLFFIPFSDSAGRFGD